MTTIFLSRAGEDRACADEIGNGLEAHGYTLWRAPDFPTPREQSYPYVIENAILGSAALILLWSRHAAADPWSKRHLLIAQRFFKPVVPVTLDATALPNTLTTETPIAVTASCQDAVALMLPRLPAPDQSSALLKLCEQASQYKHMRLQKQAIEQAAQMLQKGEQREETLAVLEYLSQSDLMTNVREKAQGVLAAATQQQQQPQQRSAPTAPARPQDARHQFGVRCKNGHVCYFDKRIVCSSRTGVARFTSVMRGLDELLLTCPVCQAEIAVDVDCEGYYG
jgi:hypothetical protein